MNLLQLKQATARLQPNHSVLMYGPPKGGKSALAGTAARIKELDNIYFIDIENGAETLLHIGLTEEEMAKITLIKIADTRDNPIAIETILQTFTSKTPLSICEIHGKIDCGECLKAKAGFIKWHLAQCTHNDLVILDSGSQLGDSAMAAACLGKPTMFKPTYDEYGMVNKWLGDVCSVIQQCRNTNFLVLTHEIALEDDEGKDKIFPLMGSKPFSMKCAKYFGTVAYVHKKMGKHVAGSSSTYRADVLTGSRVQAELEKSKEPSIADILIKGGIIRPATATPTQSEPVAATVAAEPDKKLTLTERLALKKST